MNWISTVLLVALPLAAAALLLAGLFFSRRVSDPGRRNVEADLLLDAEKGIIDLAAWRALPRESFRVASPLGYSLVCEWITVAGGTPGAAAADSATARRPVVVIVHGHSWDRAGSAKYAGMFLRLGWDAVIYDHRGCGDSEGSGTTMGFRESEDLGTVIDAVRARAGAGATIGAMGESMGAATVILYAARNPGLAFAIADCGYSDLRAVLEYRLAADFHLPAFPLLDIADLFTRARFHYSWKDISPRRALERAGGLPGFPLLIVHGEEDHYVPPSMALELAAAKRDPVTLVLVPGAGHAQSWETDREAYTRMVDGFLRGIGKPTAK